MSLEVGEFLSQFFGEGNQISLEQAESNKQLSVLVSGVEPDLEVPAVLPRRLDADLVEWFVLCGDDAALRQTQSELVAFIGPTYGRWDGVRATLRSTDPVEAAVRAFCGGRAIRFRTHGPEEFKECWSTIQTMRRVWAQRPKQHAEQIRTGASLVRQFELAAAAGDTATASAALEELRRRGLLGPENLRFLEIRSLAAQGRWSEIANAADLTDLRRIRRPWLVTEDILTAIYRTYLKAFETAEQVDAAITSTRELAGRFPEFLATRGPLRSPDVVKFFALNFASAESPEPGRINDLLEIEELGSSDRQWIRAIAQLKSPATTPSFDARQLLSRGDIDAAFAEASGNQDAAATEVLVECAYQMQTLEAAAIAIKALEGLSDADRELLLSRRMMADAVKSLQALAEPSAVGEPTAPKSWTDWFERLLRDPGWHAAEAVSVCGELEYSADDLTEPQSSENLASLITAAADSDRRQVVRDALPRIVGWLERQDFEPSVSRPIYVAVLTVIALDNAWGDAALEVAYNSAEAVLSGGVDADGYSELLDQLGLLWQRMASRRHVSWLADVLELLGLFPGPDSPRIGFAVSSIEAVRAVLSRVTPSTLDALQTALGGIGAAELLGGLPAVSEKVDIDEVPSLAGRLVGVYTLTPQVGIRAKEAIERRFPGVRVEVDSSHVSTPSLEHLAESADYLIVSIRSAKHAATDAIDRCRPKTLPTIIPGGRGSSRMVEALISALT